MDMRIRATDRPIYVDLDGTLIRTDLLWESLFLLARQAPAALVQVPLWALAGKARLKAALARRIDFDPGLLPYREALVAELAAEQAKGRRLVLATAADERLAEAVAGHLGIFDAVMASDGETNLSADRKLGRIRAEAGETGFDYIGNSRDDVCLLEEAGEALVVAPDRAARAWQRTTGSRLFEEPRESRPKAALKAMRPHQWMKNVLIFVPLALSHEFSDLQPLLMSLLAFVAFSFAASSVYIFNDLLDLAADRRHKSKRRRPFASGTLPIPTGLWLAGGLLATACALAAVLPPVFQLVLGAYLVATTLYSFFLKRMLLVDVIALASLYTVRIFAGAAATGAENSFWLMAFSIFFFLSLALVKRYTELLDLGPGAGKAVSGRGYMEADLDTLAQAGMASGFASVLVLALYIDSPVVKELNAMPWMLWPLCPLVLYIVVRIWILARRNQMHEDPVVFILQDWRSQIMIGAGALMFMTAAYV